MSYQISDYSYWQIEITDTVRTWIVPKFRLIMRVDEPNIALIWTDRENGSNNYQRTLTLDYNDVLFGVYAPSSAAEVETLIKALQDKAWDDIIGLLGNYVPYTGASQNVDITPYGLTADYVAFDLNPVAGAGAGQIVYDGQTGSLTYLLNNSTVPSHIGQTLHAYCHNAEGATINKGDAVYLYQATGNKASVKLARNLSDATSAKTLGLAAETIGAGQNGMIITVGQLQGVNTSMFSEGDTLYLANTFGDLTNVKPYAPEHLVYIGVVEKANANGEIYVRVQIGQYQSIKSFSVHADAGANFAMTNATLAERFAGNSTRAIFMVDLEGYNQVRLRGNKQVVGTAGSLFRAKYYTSFSTSVVNYLQLGASSQVEFSMAATGYADTGWVDLAPGAKINGCYIAFTELGGDAVANPALGATDILFR